MNGARAMRNGSKQARSPERECRAVLRGGAMRRLRWARDGETSTELETGPLRRCNQG